jgi:hypothetical protein
VTNLENLNFTNILDNPKNYLYCYKSEKASLYSLVNKSLRFSPIGTLNDPIENTLQTFFLDTDTRFQKSQLPEYTNLLKAITKKYCDSFIKVLCFTLSNDPEPKTLIPQSHMGYMRFSMWSQYAEFGKGTCIILDKNKLDTEFDKLLSKENIFGKSGQINYTEDFSHSMAFRFRYDEFNLLKEGKNILKPKIQEYYKEYFFKKRKDWSNENEYRYVIVSERIQYLDITHSITGIVFGYSSSKEFISLVNNLDHFKKVPKVKIMLQGYHAYIEGY